MRKVTRRAIAILNRMAAARKKRIAAARNGGTSGTLAGRGCVSGLTLGTIKVWLVFTLGEVSAAFNGDALSTVGSRRGNVLLPSTITSFLSTAAPGLSSHLGALFSQDRFARELDAIALNRQHFHQDLIALVQFVANIFDAMFV